MKNWFSIKAKYLEADDKGFSRLALRTFLLDAINYTDAEKRAYEELQMFLNKEFTVETITKTNINEVFIYDDGAIWWKAKIQYTVEDADSEKEKKILQYMILPADDLRIAYDRLEENLKTLMVDWKILNIQLSPIIHIFPDQTIETVEPVKQE